MENIPMQGRKLSQQKSTKAQLLPTTILYMHTIDTRVWFSGTAHWIWPPAEPKEMQTPFTKPVFQSSLQTGNASQIISCHHRFLSSNCLCS